MDHLAEHRRILELAASDQLPDRIDEDSILSVDVCRELYEQGLIEAADATTMDNVEYLRARITIAGPEYLSELQHRVTEASPAGRARRIGLRTLDWGLGILAGLLIAWGAGKF